jgi:hypothetical protein
MILKSAEIKRVFYNIDPGGKDHIVLSDYDDEVRRIRAEALKDAGQRAVVYAMTRTAVWPEELRAAIIGKELPND